MDVADSIAYMFNKRIKVKIRLFSSKSSHTVDYILIFSLSYFISHAVLYAQHPSMQTFASFPHHIFSIIYFGMYLFY